MMLYVWYHDYNVHIYIILFMILYACAIYTFIHCPMTLELS